VTFKPTAAGAKTGTLQVTGAPGGTLPVALTGTGVQAAVLAVTPATQDFGTVGVGLSSPPVTYTVTNTGRHDDGAGHDHAVRRGVRRVGLDLHGRARAEPDVHVQGRVQPAAIAMKSATVAAAAGTVTATATITGNGVAAPALTLTPRRARLRHRRARRDEADHR
jgi:hypothetical protein